MQKEEEEEEPKMQEAKGWNAAQCNTQERIRRAEGMEYDIM